MTIDTFWNEPDFYFEEREGYHLFAMRNSMKAWCGYVGVAPTHPLFGKEYDERIAVPDRSKIKVDKVNPIAQILEAMKPDDGKVSLDVLTNTHGGITFSGKNQHGNPGRWYFGFDCSHYNDLTPSGEYRHEKHWSPQGTYRTLSYVKSEIDNLFLALKALS